MTQETLTLRIEPEETEVATHPGDGVLEVLSETGILMTTPCGHQAMCGKCRILVTEGVSDPSDAERQILSEEELNEGVRLACQTHVIGDAVVTVPSESRAAEMRVLVGGARRDAPFDPAIVKKSVTWTEQSLSGALSQFDHLSRLLDIRADLTAGLSVLTRLPALFADAEGKELTAVIRNKQLISVEEGNSEFDCFGIACDIGTTTIVGTLLDLKSGNAVSTASAVNGQTHYGHDVISRIHYVLENPDGLQVLQSALMNTVNDIIGQLLSPSKVDPQDVYELTVVGNATMTHIFMGVDPRSLGFLPYIPVMNHAVEADAASLGLKVNPIAEVHVLPGIAGYVGADTVGALLAAGMDNPGDGIQMLADVGTNCEIVLHYEGRLMACSTPAGPAFEGARIQHGMYAGPGAIEKVRLDVNGDCECKVIGRVEPRGICGSGLVDIGAELLRAGLMDETGRLLAPDEVDTGLSPLLRGRIREDEAGIHFVLAENSSGEAIVLTQRDIRELQLAKAAIRSGVEALLDAVDLKPADLTEFYLAGGFGSYLDSRQAIRLGMIPEIAEDRIHFIGNAAVVGARLALVSTDMRRRAEKLARSAEHLQIAETAEFQMRFADAMLFDL
ncbi:MAG: DUF4445 domain-containing protein [Candidatus Latescibacteria bacterium]|nr:DUF4445 domain-containing protein [Candidatus Latescibacterota bacterium]